MAVDGVDVVDGVDGDSSAAPRVSAPQSTKVHFRPRPLPLTSTKVHSPSSTDVH